MFFGAKNKKKETETVLAKELYSTHTLVGAGSNLNLMLPEHLREHGYSLLQKEHYFNEIIDRQDKQIALLTEILAELRKR